MKPLVLLLSACAVFAAATGGKVLFREDFSAGLKPLWQKVPFEGETKYSVLKEGTNSCLKAEAHSSASALAVKLDSLPATGAKFSWEWKIDRTPPGASDDSKPTFDHTARLFVAFKTLIGPPRTINYVWANHAPIGSTFHHPSSGRSRFIVLETGNDKAGQWLHQGRDIAADWKLLFGDDDPPAIVGLGLMTDSDGTKSTVTGWYRALELRSTR